MIGLADNDQLFFFRGNVFILKIDSIAHYPMSLKSSLIFGPLGLPHRLHLLRNLREIELSLVIDEHSLWGFRRRQARIQHFVDIIRQHVEDKQKVTASALAHPGCAAAASLWLAANKLSKLGTYHRSRMGYGASDQLDRHRGDHVSALTLCGPTLMALVWPVPCLAHAWRGW